MINDEWRWGQFVPQDEKIAFNPHGRPGGHGFSWTEQLMIFN